MPQDLSTVLEPGDPVLLAAGYGATEGPVYHPDGSVTFVDYAASRLLRWDPAGGAAVVREGTGEGNGCTLDRQRRLLMCEAADIRRITRMDSDGSITVLAERWQGKRLNRPNDIICRSDGAVFFTDPEMRCPPDKRELGFSGVFRITPRGEIVLCNGECEYPNGLALSVDESLLYVAISRRDEGCLLEEERGEVCSHMLIRVFDVSPDGDLTNNRILVRMTSAEPGVPDGIKVDRKGRIFCTGPEGIWVMDDEGGKIGVIRLPEVPRNMAFGGDDFRTLYVTAGHSLYSVRVKTPGVGAF